MRRIGDDINTSRIMQMTRPLDIKVEVEIRIKS